MKILYPVFFLLFIAQIQAQSLDICVTNVNGMALSNVDFDLSILPVGTTYEANDDGCYTLSYPENSPSLNLQAQRDPNSILNGVSTFDLVLINKHILGITLFDSPYQIIAADVNRSNSITALDLFNIRQVILGVSITFPNSDMENWRFFDASFAIDPINPFAIIPPESIFLTAPFPTSVGFTGVKLGDVNGSAFFSTSETRSATKTLHFNTKDQAFKKDEIVKVDFSAKDFQNILGYQFTLDYDTDILAYQDLQKGVLDIDNNNLATFEKEGQLVMSWNDIATTNKDNDLLFSLQFEAKADGLLSDFLQLNSSKIKTEAYEEGAAIELLDVALTFDALEHDATLIQNVPNPFKESTSISFTLLEDDKVTLDFYTLDGKLIKSIKQHLSKGAQQLSIDKNDLSCTGTLIYKLTTSRSSITKKMIVLD